ncbi:ORF6C domain-containing protein [Cupriavidus basilensis]|uniref:ORF6C domain-containing protein n=1 Tax=Cupriavidus basilensis TaxID=68895 RepID=UPI0039F68639
MVDEALEKLNAKLREVLGPPSGTKPQQRPGTTIAPVLNVSGGVVYFGDGQTINNVYTVKPKITVVQTGLGVVDASQKARLLELRDQIAGVSRAIEGQTVSPATIMRKLNAHMNVNSYAEIPSDKFDRAESYLVRWRGRLDGMPGANHSQGWRDRRVRAIHARCKELGCDQWRINYMRKAWGKESLIDLPDDQLEKMYLAVMRRK